MKRLILAAIVGLAFCRVHAEEPSDVQAYGRLLKTALEFADLTPEQKTEYKKTHSAYEVATISMTISYCRGAAHALVATQHSSSGYKLPQSLTGIQVARITHAYINKRPTLTTAPREIDVIIAALKEEHAY